MDEVNFLGGLNQGLFPARFGSLLTDEVVITAERMERIMEQHPIDADEKHPPNSVMTFYRIREKNLIKKNNLPCSIFAE